MINQTEKKEELIRMFNNLKEVKHYTFKEEDQILSLLDKVATSLFGNNYDYCSTSEYATYCNNIIKKDIKREKEKAQASKILVTGFL